MSASLPHLISSRAVGRWRGVRNIFRAEWETLLDLGFSLCEYRAGCGASGCLACGVLYMLSV